MNTIHSTQNLLSNQTQSTSGISKKTEFLGHTVGQAVEKLVAKNGNNHSFSIQSINTIKIILIFLYDQIFLMIK